MKKNLLALAALGLIAAAAQAETYDGVHQFVSAKSADAARAEAVATASAPDQNVVAGSRGALPFKSVADTAKVRAEAVSTAYASDTNVVPGSRVNSKVISTFKNPGLNNAAVAAK
ncbi:MAG: DUF4148 domain-containing protein [Variovorax sp.]|nr:DUF4148 domain-containing protein [Variovorax sp.]